MTEQRESQGHSERPSAPAATRDAPLADKTSAADFLSIPEPAPALPVTTGADDSPSGNTPQTTPPTTTSLTPYLDAHGFDPGEYKWVPVRRRPRKDGWSEARQRLFIEQLADSACVETAAKAVRMSVQSAYALRRAPGGEAFAAAWEAAIQQGAHKLADVAFQRALHGTDEPVFDRSGIVIGHKTRYSERLMMFLMRAHLPERYAPRAPGAHRAERPEGAPSAPPTPPPILPVAEALARLEPVLPPEPHNSMPAEDLDVELEVADMLDGELPHYYWALPPEPAQMPLGEDFERELEAAKRGEFVGFGDQPMAQEQPTRNEPAGKTRPKPRSKPPSRSNSRSNSKPRSKNRSRPKLP